MTAYDNDELVSIVAVSYLPYARANGHNLVARTRSSHLNVLITHAGCPGDSVGKLETF